MASSDVSRLAVIVILAYTSNCYGESLSTGNQTCLSLDQCTCKVTSNGLRMLCSLVADVDKLREDISMLKGITVESLGLSRVNMTTLPAFFFGNVTIRMLRVTSSPMESVSDDAFAGIGTLGLLDLSRNRLTTIPRAIRAIKELSLLYLASNRIRVVGGELAHLSSSLRRVLFSRNQIVTLHRDAFRNFTRLQRVGLANNAIEKMPTTLFSAAPALELIDLRWNLIEDVGDVFQRAHSLQALYLTDNRIRNIRQLAAARLRSLKELSLDNNPIDAASLFGPYEVAIESLSLRNCNVSNVDAIALGCLPRLRYVNLAKNAISYIDSGTFPRSADISSFRKFIFKELEIYRNCSATGAEERTAVLQIIDLSSNRIRDINNAFVGLKLLETLRLRENEIEYVPDDAFSTNENLKELYLNDNKISWLGNNCFRGLTSLKTLHLSGNRLASFNGSLSYASALQHLSVQQNRLRRFQNTDFVGNPGLKFVYAYENRISDVRGAFRDIHDLTVLRLQNNRLKSIHRASFYVPTLKLKKLLIEGNPIRCDCQLSWLHEADIQITENGNAICQSPRWMKGYDLRNSTTTAMLRSWPEDCDRRCVCTCHEDDDYGKHTQVNCSHANLTHLPEVFPEDAYIIDLSGNRLRALDRRLSDSTPNLQTLLLKDNLLAELDPMSLPNGLQQLSLQNNRFTNFPTNIVSQLNLSGVWLSGNPWACTCEDFAFRLWAEANEMTIKDGDSLACAEGTNPQVSLHPFLKLEQKDLCPLRLATYMVLGVLILVLLSVSLCIAVVYLTRKREIKVWMYAHGLRCVKERDLDSDKVFDVFMSFSSKDSDWAYTYLIPGIEKAGFSVCTYDRNFKGGFMLQDIIQDAVSSSRRTLLLLTRNFVESEWCRWEFRVAYQCALQDKVNRLIVVVIDKIPDGVDDDLLVYMRATNYLRWGEKHFWHKLKYSLPNSDTQPKRVSYSQTAPLSVV